MTDQSTQPMNDRPAEGHEAAAKKRPSRSSEFVAILSSAIALGVLLVAMASVMTILLTNQLTAIMQDLNASQARADADRRAFQAEAAADRRAFDARMEEFRREMGEFRREVLRLSERQSRLEGMQEVQASATAPGS